MICYDICCFNMNHVLNFKISKILYALQHCNMFLHARFSHRAPRLFEQIFTPQLIAVFIVRLVF